MIGEPAGTPASRLARAAAATAWQTTSPAIRQQALDYIVDTLAVIAAGGGHASLRGFIEQFSGGSGRCTVIGRSQTVPPTTAALLNGAATTVLQLQDGHRMARGHPASHVIPAALAVAEQIGASMDGFLSAVIAGYEVGARVGRALGGLQSLLHDAGTFGTIGAAVAASHLLSHGDADQIAEAIEGAAAVALFPYRDTPLKGATVHHLYIGLGASTGVTVAQAVAAGMGSLSGTLDQFFGPRAGFAFEPELLTAGLASGDTWDDYELLKGYFKIHPTCAHLNGINDAVVELLERRAFRTEDIVRVDIASYGYALEYNTPEPINDLAARFSIPYAVAIALHTGALHAESISDVTIALPAVRELADKVRVEHDPSLDRHYPSSRPAVVTVTLRDGEQHRAETLISRGDDRRPLCAVERSSKALALLATRFGAERAPEILAVLRTMPEQPDVTQIGAVLRGGSGEN